MQREEKSHTNNSQEGHTNNRAKATHDQQEENKTITTVQQPSKNRSQNSPNKTSKVVTPGTKKQHQQTTETEEKLQPLTPMLQLPNTEQH
jgi:hypothetical protein